MKLKRLRKLLKNEFFRNFLTLFTGSSIAQAIPFIITPFLTRLFPNEIFGIFFVYSSTIMILSILSTLQYELAIVLPKKEKDAANLLALSLITTFIVSLITLIIIILLFDSITIMLGSTQIGKWLYFIPLSIFFTGIFQSCSYWNNRKKNYKLISYGKITKSFSSGTVQLTGGYLGFLKIGLIPGLIFGQFISAFYILIRTFKNYKYFYKIISLKNIIFVAKKYKDIPLFNTLISLLNTLSNHLPIFLLTKYYGLRFASFYGLSNRIINTPMGLIGQSVGQVFYQKASEIYNNKQNFYDYIKKTYWRLFKVAIIPFVVIAIIAPYLFEYLFGSEWVIAGKFTQILIPWLFIGFLNSPISYIITILNKQKKFLLYDILLLIFRFLSLYLGYKIYNDAFISILFYSLTGLCFNIFLIFYFLTISKKTKFE